MTLMDMKIDYSELERLVRDKAGVELKFSYVSPDTLNVSYPLSLMGRTKGVAINIRVVSVYGNDVVIEYSAEGGAIVNMALNAVLNPYKAKLGDKATFGSANSVTLHLDKIDKLSPVLEKMQLSRISFSATAVELDTSVR